MSTHPKFNNSGPDVQYQPKTTDNVAADVAGNVVPHVNIDGVTPVNGKLPVDLGGAALTLTGPVTIGNEVEVKNDAGNPVNVSDPALGAAADAPTAFSVIGLLKALKDRLLGTLTIAEVPFTPLRAADGTPLTFSMVVGTTKTTTPKALPAVTGATSVRVRYAGSSASATSFMLATDPAKVAVIPVPWDLTGSNGILGDKTMDPGTAECFGLSAAQITALAAGTLYPTGLCPVGTGVLQITPGNGG